MSLLNFLVDIEGFLSPEEEEFIYSKIKSLPDNAVIFEIGAYKGRSTVIMGYACIDTKRKIYSVNARNDLVDVWKQNINRHKISEFVNPLVGTSDEILERWLETEGENTMDFALIDGSRGYPDILKDFEAAYPLVKEGGYIAFHNIEERQNAGFVWYEVAAKTLGNHELCKNLASGQKFVKGFCKRAHGKNLTKDMLLKITHNAGFFSCCTIRLQEIVKFFNENKTLPSSVDSTHQFEFYKAKTEDNLMPVFFNAEAEQMDLACSWPVNLQMDCMLIQFDNYKKIDFENLKGFIHKYFMPSMEVLKYTYEYTKKYSLDYKNLCSVFYRGNDKAIEMDLPSYDSFIEKAKEVKANNPDIKFLVQTDEVEFSSEFIKAFPDSIFFKELPMISKQQTSILFTLPREERAVFGAKFYSAVLSLSQCSHVITHSGNCGLWLTLYRGHANNLHQIHNGIWM